MTNYLIAAGFIVALIFVAGWVLWERRALDRDNREGNRSFTLHTQAMQRDARTRR